MKESESRPRTLQVPHLQSLLGIESSPLLSVVDASVRVDTVSPAQAIEDNPFWGQMRGG
jgi:hypothetical protein